MKRFLKPFLLGGMVLVLGLGLSACGNQKPTTQSTQTNTNTSHTVVSANESKLANLKYQSGKSAIVNVNHNKATIKPTWKNDHVHYAKLDALQRTSFANTGWLDSKNVANDSLRTRQIFKPTGYHQKFVNNQAIINRGHEIAYSLSKGISQSGKYNPKAESGDQNNPKNLFTQTAFSNQELQTIYESKVRNALKHNEKVVYQVQPIFKGKDEMANGVHMQAISTNRKLDYNVYIFNVQPGMEFNYKNGRSKVDHAMKVPTPKGAPHFNDNNNRNRNYKRHGYNYRNYGRRYYNRYRNPYKRNYRHHHFIRDYMAYRAGRHLLRHHYMNKYGYYRHFGHPYMRYHRFRTHRF